MWLNQQTIDAIRIMADLAARWPVRARASDLPLVTGITLMNIQKTVHQLSLAQLVDTQRGRSGGMTLSRAPQMISIGAIVRAFEPTDCPVNFLVEYELDKAISNVLFRAHRGFFLPLESTTLDQLVRKPALEKANPHN